ncbi:glycoside hydrolase family 2 protein [Amycolatopsis magusensis]|uniref:glycoside hydrolase family 2 protein n=1 Tax=Amycolatopsis magusensis TaxID=882444 RepID=UPI0024A856E4|nr:sugar-binding domain-containing protein [Amycolatopsis magusensis]MDI5976386.1 glycoside hydrolase family 2 TIM barrel-domain containing protein [Amycolatopsis magusensis]
MRLRRTPKLLAALAVFVPLLSAQAPGPPAPAGAPMTAPAASGRTSTVPDWRLQTSKVVTADGDALSQPAYDDSGWYPVPARSTVLAGLVANGKYGDVNYGTNLQRAERSEFTVPWWYRKAFTADPQPGAHTFLKLNGGIISRGEVWLNGVKVAGTDQVVGAYPTHEFDVTSLLRKGDNALAIKAMPADPQQDLSIHFIDWAQLPPDRNQGLFRDVQLTRSGAVSLRDIRADGDLPLPDLSSADVTVKADVRNNSAQSVTTEISGKVGEIPLNRTVTLAPGETSTLTFSPADTPALKIAQPQVWWPFTMGGQPMYEASLDAAVGGALSDSVKTKFGIREVTSRLNQGAREFSVNGKPFLVRGGGWASDLFLRTDLRRIGDQLNLVRSMGMNTIRLEGKPENDEFYDLADQLGIMLLTGWECCSKWEDYGSFDAEDNVVAGQSAESEAKRIRNHPSMLGFMIGSDAAPGAGLEKIYLDALNRADWKLPVISSAKAFSSPQLGSPGMKMDGPYWWEPPNYWYNEQKGGAFGFASEIGPGPTIPEMEELKKFLTPEDIAKLTDYNATQYHLSPSTTFNKLSFWGTALDRRYGRPANPEALVRKAQLANYETNRAQFEAFGRDWSDWGKPATGVIYWMLNNAWPTAYWHLYDYYLDTAGSYFGAKTALRPLHVQYSYDDKSLAVVNTGLETVPGLRVEVTVFNADGTEKAKETRPVEAKANGSVRVGTLPQPAGLSTTYFTRLLLTDAAGKVLDRNVYWLSTRADTLDYGSSTWYHTPQTGYADLTGLDQLPKGSLAAHAKSTVEGDRTRTEVTLTNNAAGGQVAFFVKATVRKGVGGPEVLPTDWSDNYVTLWPGETLRLSATYRSADLGGTAPVVELSGHNVEPLVVAAPGRY